MCRLKLIVTLSVKITISTAICKSISWNNYLSVVHNFDSILGYVIYHLFFYIIYRIYSANQIKLKINDKIENYQFCQVQPEQFSK